MWVYQRYECLERIHLLACKKFLSVGIATPNNMVYGECGRYPLFINSQIKCLKYWFNITCMPEHRLPKIAYNMLFHLDTIGKITWASRIRTILSSHGFGYIWLYQSVGNITIFLNDFRKVAIDMFYQGWQSNLENSSRYDLYKTFKTLLEPERYLSVLTNRQLRNAYVKYRLGLSKLMINFGRYTSLERTQRICSLCNSAIEDEIHFTFECPYYADIRTRYIPERFLTKGSSLAFASILSSNDNDVIFKLALFVKHGMDLRLNLLNGISNCYD